MEKIPGAKQRTKELYLQGFSVKEIVERVGFAHDTAVYPILKELRLSTRNPYNVIPDLRPSKQLAYLMGALYGDGSVSGGTISLRVTQQCFAESVAAAMRSIGLKTIVRLPRIIGDFRKQQYNAEACNRNFVRWYSKTPVDQVLGESKERQLAFLRGFYEAEGSLIKRFTIYKSRKSSYWRVSISNTNMILMHFIRSMLIDLGYNPKLYAMQPHGGFGGKAIVYRIDLHRQREVTRFLNETKPCVKNFNLLKEVVF